MRVEAVIGWPSAGAVEQDRALIVGAHPRSRVLGETEALVLVEGAVLGDLLVRIGSALTMTARHARAKDSV